MMTLWLTSLLALTKIPDIILESDHTPQLKLVDHSIELLDEMDG